MRKKVHSALPNKLIPDRVTTVTIIFEYLVTSVNSEVFEVDTLVTPLPMHFLALIGWGKWDRHLHLNGTSGDEHRSQDRKQVYYQ